MNAADLELLIASGRATDAELADAGIEYTDVAAIKSETPFQVRAFASKIRAPKGDGSRTVGYVFSTEDKDRMGDRIRVYGGKHAAKGVAGKGWQLTHYKANPVFLWSHESWNPPIGISSRVRKDKIVGADGQLKNALVGDVTFHTADENPLAETAFKLVSGGKLPGSSVGFMPILTNRFESEEERRDMGLGEQGVEFVEQELLEHSLAVVPANPFALATGLKDLVSTGLLTDKDADRFAQQCPLSEDDLRKRLKEKVRSFVDFGRSDCPPVSATDNGWTATWPAATTCTLGTTGQGIIWRTGNDDAERKLADMRSFARAAFEHLSDAQEQLGLIFDMEDGDERVAPIDALQDVVDDLRRVVAELSTRNGGPAGSQVEPDSHAPDTDEGHGGGNAQNTKKLLEGAADMVQSLRSALQQKSGSEQ